MAPALPFFRPALVRSGTKYRCHNSPIGPPHPLLIYR